MARSIMNRGEKAQHTRAILHPEDVVLLVQQGMMLDDVWAVYWTLVELGQDSVRFRFDDYVRQPGDILIDIDVRTPYKTAGFASALDRVVKKHPHLLTQAGLRKAVELVNVNNATGFMKRDHKWSLAKLIRFTSDMTPDGMAAEEWAEEVYARFAYTVQTHHGYSYAKSAGETLRNDFDEEFAAEIKIWSKGQIGDWCKEYEKDGMAIFWTLPGFLRMLWAKEGDREEILSEAAFFMELFRKMEKLPGEARAELARCKKDETFAPFTLVDGEKKVDHPVLFLQTDNRMVASQVWGHPRYKGVVEVVVVRNSKGNVVILASRASGLNFELLARDLQHTEPGLWGYNPWPSGDNVINGGPARPKPPTKLSWAQLKCLISRNVSYYREGTQPK